MQLALAQYSLKSDLTSNLGKAIHLMEIARQKGADIIVFPELCLSPFFPRVSGLDARKYAMQINDEPIRRFRAACRKLRLIASPNIYLQQDSRFFDASLMIGADGELGDISTMVHIAQLPGFYEQDYYSPSDTGFHVYDTSFGKIGIVVCFDRHFPESTRTCVLKGAELIIVPTANTMSEPRDLFECELRAAALQNGVYIAMCNRVGTEGNATFCGESVVIDPDGTVVKQSGQIEELVVVDIDFARVATVRKNRPYVALRRPETYA